MRCPKCHHEDTRVYDSRQINTGKAIRRRRECPQCEYRFTTREEVTVFELKVEKRNGQLVDFDIQRLEKGIKKAFNKRSIDNSKVDKVVQKIVDEIMSSDKTKIKSTRIGRIVLKNLREVDEAAYICFWAMFGNFETADEFNTLLKKFNT